jgi:hypothetical protein
MKIKIEFKKVFEIYLGVMALGLVVLPKLITLLIIGLGLIVISGFVFKMISFQFNKIGISLMLFYVAYLIGVFFTNNPEQASVYVENKLSFLIFPLLFFFKLKERLDMKYSYLGFISGVVMVTFIGLLNSYSCYCSPEGGISCFLSSVISPLHHPTYFTVFVLISICFSIHGWKEKMDYFSPYWVIPYVIFYIVFQGLLLSLSGILFLFILISFIIIIWIKKKFGNMYFLLSIFVLPIVCFKLMLSVPQIEGEWGNAKWYADEYFKNPDEFVSKRVYPMSGTEVRIVMWTAAINGISHHPFGVGTGNVDEYLAKELTALRQDELIEYQYNPHNQFLQTTLEIGVFGLLILLLFITFALQFAVKHKNWILVILVLNLVFNSLFESMLQRQSGIVFYSFWICLLAFHEINKKANSKIYLS